VCLYATNPAEGVNVVSRKHAAFGMQMRYEPQ